MNSVNLAMPVKANGLSFKRNENLQENKSIVPFNYEDSSEVDMFVPKKKLPTTGQLITAGATAFGTAKGIYNKKDVIVDKLKNVLTTVADDFGKTFNGIPKVAQGAIKYGAIAAGAVATFVVTLKDSDNDGKLDILEGLVSGVKKYIVPDQT